MSKITTAKLSLDNYWLIGGRDRCWQFCLLPIFCRWRIPKTAKAFWLEASDVEQLLGNYAVELRQDYDPFYVDGRCEYRFKGGRRWFCLVNASGVRRAFRRFGVGGNLKTVWVRVHYQ